MCPHVPQLLMSVCRLTQIIVLPSVHMLVAFTHVQTPLLLDPGWQVTPAGQTLPQVLQLFGS